MIVVRAQAKIILFILIPTLGVIVTIQSQPPRRPRVDKYKHDDRLPCLVSTHLLEILGPCRNGEWNGGVIEKRRPPSDLASGCLSAGGCWAAGRQPSWLID